MIKESAAYLREIVHLDTHPVGIKLYAHRQEWKGSLLKNKTNICQMVSMSRYQGVTVAQTADQMICSLGAACLGMIKTPERFTSGEAVVGKYTNNAENGKQFIKNTYKLGDNGRIFDIMVTGPLASMEDPDIVVIYLNPAQILPFIHAFTYDNGNKITADTVAEAALCSSMGYTLGEKKPIIGFPCAGDRRFAGTQSHELLIAFPISLLSPLIENLKTKAKTNPQLYPVAPAMNWVPVMPPAYTLQDDDLVD